MLSFNLPLSSEAVAVSEDSVCSTKTAFFKFNHMDNCDWGGCYITVSQLGNKFTLEESDSNGYYEIMDISYDEFIHLLNDREWALEPSSLVHYPTSLEEDKELDNFLFGSC